MTIIYAEIYESCSLPSVYFHFFARFRSVAKGEACRAECANLRCLAIKVSFCLLFLFVLQINPRWTAPPHPRTPRCPPRRPRPATTSSRAGSAAARAAAAVQQAEEHPLEQGQDQEQAAAAAARHCVSFKLWLCRECPFPLSFWQLSVRTATWWRHTAHSASLFA